MHKRFVAAWTLHNNHVIVAGFQENLCKSRGPRRHAQPEGGRRGDNVNAGDHMPPSFFDVMSHLVLHLVEELELCGPVHTRWIYNMERMNKVLKRYMNNMARPEAYMVKSYVLDEVIGLVEEFMAEEYEPLHCKVWTEKAAAGIIGEVLQGAATIAVITPYMRDIAHEYMLLNRTSFQSLCMYHSNQYVQTFIIVYAKSCPYPKLSCSHILNLKD